MRDKKDFKFDKQKGGGKEGYEGERTDEKNKEKREGREDEGWILECKNLGDPREAAGSA